MRKFANLYYTVNMLSSLDITHSPSVLLKTSAGVCLSYVLISVVLSYFSAQARWLRKQEWIGYRKEWLSDVRAGLRSVLGTRAIVMANYEKSKEGFLALPQFMSKPLLLLPPNKLRDLLQKPEDEVNLYIVLTEWLGGK